MDYISHDDRYRYGGWSNTNWFEQIKKYYDAGLWTEKMVGNAVVKKKITAEQYKEITGEDYNK